MVQRYNMRKLIPVIIAYAAIMVLNNNVRDLWEPEELRYAEITREMLVNGDWVLLHINGVPYPDKPPLFFWLMALTCVSTGTVSAWAIRLTSAVAGLGCLVLTYRLGARLRDERLGLLCAWLLFTTPFFTWTAGEARMDMLLTLFIMGALYCFYADYSSKQEAARRWAAAYVLMGLGVLTKGPIGFLLPMLTILFYLLWMRDLRFLRSYHPMLGLLIVLAVVAPWVAATCVKGGEQFSSNLLFRQNIGRYTHAWLHRHPFYHYFGVVPGVFMPWTLFLPGMIAFTFLAKDPDTRAKLRLPLTWFLTIFVFFSLSDSKRTIYILPLMPALTLWAGMFLQQAVRARSPLHSWAKYAIVACGVIFLCLGVCGPFAAKAKYPDVVAQLVPVSVVVAVGAILVLARVRAGHAWRAVVAIQMCVLASFVTMQACVLPYANTRKSARLMVRQLRPIVGPTGTLAVYCSRRAGYAFYWGKAIPAAKSKSEFEELVKQNPQTFLLMKRKFLNELQSSPAANVSVLWSGTLGGRDLVLVGPPKAAREGT